MLIKSLDNAGDRIDWPELLVKAENWNEVGRILKSELSIDQKFEAADKQIKGYYIVRFYTDSEQINQDFYDAIKKSKYINLLYDGKKARQNREEALRYIERIESRLRKLLIYISDSVDNYYGILGKKGAGKNLVARDDINPLTSHLEFGELVKVLAFDISESRRTVDEIVKIVEAAEDFTQLKRNINERLSTRRVWDVISDILLYKPTAWDDIKKDIADLKGYRNKAAHFRTITDNDLDNVKLIVARISNILKLRTTKPLSLDEEKALASLYDAISETLAEQAKIQAEAENQIRAKTLEDFFGLSRTE